MLLAVDVGNTNTVLGLFTGEELVRSWRITTHARATGDEMALTFRGLLDEQPEITGLALCSTVPSVLHELRPMLSSFYHEIPVVIVEPGTKTGVPILTDNPKEVGADRIVNTLAAHQQFGGPCIVVDFGTSTNLDVVSAQGEFLGGALAPGIDISLEALSAKAAQLRKVEVVRPRSPIGKNTVEALQSGAVFGFAGQVDGLVDRIIEEIGPVTAVVATGGLASVVIGESETITHHDPHLTLTGLRMVFERNVG
ncbi:MAG: type III pantothenate kinase [Candidatus Nanopelagicales bacterium]|jgi:type III pantothenate kinase|nr:type III pantothenate kinase [Actinomycetota bacterium]NDA49310.1 type III pantothenate kinase [Actinomycetota bacterium]NDA58399.1 type III pantothenate kinase [Actinomycetota bacterium]NDG94446.1 type III pantothenate kinase [Actinomycetota bacterium]NDH17958.1 type III pantothenate kinase [Actinomycetota bacterium]